MPLITTPGMIGNATGSHNGVLFDGASRLVRDADLTGAANSKLWTCSLWFKRDVLGTVQRLYKSSTINSGATQVQFLASNLIEIQGHKSNETTEILTIASSAQTDTASWHHLLFSVDLANADNRHIYIDDGEDLNSVTDYIDFNIDFTRNNHAVGSATGSSDKFEGCLYDFWMEFGTYIDFSVVANRRKFTTANGAPVDLGLDGSTPTGSAPILFFSGAISAWHLNKGGGGGMNETGALLNCGTRPS